MNYQFSRSQHAALSLLLLIIAGAIVYYILLMPAFTGRINYQERRDELGFQHEKISQSLAQKDELKREIERLKQAAPDRTGFLEDQSPALAAAELQKHINSLVSSNGGNVVSTQVVRNAGDSIFPEITIKVHLRCDMENLRNLLYEIKTGKPMLLLDNLLIQKRNVSSSRRNRQDIEQIDIRFDVTGFIYRTSA